VVIKSECEVCDFGPEKEDDASRCLDAAYVAFERPKVREEDGMRDNRVQNVGHLLSGVAFVFVNAKRIMREPCDF
jgi:hypothetical protein